MSGYVMLRYATRAELNALAARRALVAYEPVLIEDEGRMAIAMSASSYVAAAKEGEIGSGGAWGGITGTLSDQADLQAALDGKAAAAHNHDASYAALGHNHAGVYQPYDANMIAWPAAVSATEVGYLDGVTSAIQTQLNGKQAAGSYENTSNKGVANGYAGLDATGKVPSAQLPSFVDDVLEYANLAAFPGTGESGKIYVALDTNKTYRWSGSAYVEISASPGTTDSVTEGSVNLYFTYQRVRDTVLTGLSTATNAVITAADSILVALGKLQKQITDHLANTSNPHSVTKAQVGLGSVENTALSTWAGSANITTVGTIATGTWNAETIAIARGGTGATDTATARANIGALYRNPIASGAFNFNSPGSTGSHIVELKNNSSISYTNGPSGYVGGALIHIEGSHSLWNAQLAFNQGSSPGIWIRGSTDSGGTASWGAWSKVWNESNDGSGSGLDADLLDGIHGNQYARSDYFGGDMNSMTGESRVTSVDGTANTPFGNAWYNIVNVRHRGGISDGNVWGGQIAFGMTAHQTRMAFRAHSSGTWQSWNEVAVLSNANTWNAKQTMPASASGAAGFCLPHGSAPSSPVNGDIWTTSVGIYARINGATQQLALGNSFTLAEAQAAALCF